ncbi:MAG: GNAT family N-acetyltransferase [Aggregatilineales bacterium]
MAIRAYRFRALSARDFETLQSNCWPGHSLDFVRTWLDRTLALAAQGKAFGLVVVPEQRDDCPIAYGQITCWLRVAEISDLIVAETWRGCGIGSALIQALVTIASTWSVPSVEIGVALSNPRALSLYRRLGFVDARTLTLDLGCGPEPVLYLNMPLGNRAAAN